jgi:hypothetical protein
MTETFRLLNAYPTTPTLTYVGIPVVPTSTIELANEGVDSDGSKFAEYDFQTGDSRYKMQARVRVSVEKNPTLATLKRFSVKFTGHVRHEDSTLDEPLVGIYPVETILSWQVPVAMLNTAALDTTFLMLGTVLNLVANSTVNDDQNNATLLTGPDSSTLNALNFLRAKAISKVALP